MAREIDNATRQKSAHLNRVSPIRDIDDPQSTRSGNMGIIVYKRHICCRRRSVKADLSRSGRRRYLAGSLGKARLGLPSNVGRLGGLASSNWSVSSMARSNCASTPRA
jgi:hypothetical protein